MKSWWSARAPREQLLLGLASLVLTGALLVQGVLIPSLHGRAAAGKRADDAARTLVRLARLQQTGATYAPPTTGASPAEAATRAAQTAADLGLVRRAAADPSDPLRFAFDPAAPTVVFSWIDRVETELGLTLQSADMASASAGQVAATLAFTGDRPQ